jgi:hypothetical protein
MLIVSVDIFEYIIRKHDGKRVVKKKKIPAKEEKPAKKRNVKSANYSYVAKAGDTEREFV